MRGRVNQPGMVPRLSHRGRFLPSRRRFLAGDDRAYFAPGQDMATVSAYSVPDDWPGQRALRVPQVVWISVYLDAPNEFNMYAGGPDLHVYNSDGGPGGVTHWKGPIYTVPNIFGPTLLPDTLSLARNVADRINAQRPGLTFARVLDLNRVSGWPHVDPAKNVGDWPVLPPPSADAFLGTDFLHVILGWPCGSRPEQLLEFADLTAVAGLVPDPLPVVHYPKDLIWDLFEESPDGPNGDRLDVYLTAGAPLVPDQFAGYGLRLYGLERAPREVTDDSWAVLMPDDPPFTFTTPAGPLYGLPQDPGVYTGGPAGMILTAVNLDAGTPHGPPLIVLTGTDLGPSDYLKAYATKVSSYGLDARYMGPIAGLSEGTLATDIAAYFRFELG